MGNVSNNSFDNTTCLNKNVEMNADKSIYTKDNYDKFVNTLTRIVEKYGKVILEELKDAA